MAINRALITAPVARDLFAETGRPVVKIPNATNGVLQAYDTLDQDYFAALNDAALTIYPTLTSIPPALRKYVIQFLRYDTVAANSGAAWRRWQDCTAADFIKTSNGVKAVTALAGGDRPTEYELMHHWLGNVAESLGAA